MISLDRIADSRLFDPKLYQDDTLVYPLQIEPGIHLILNCVIRKSSISDKASLIYSSNNHLVGVVVSELLLEPKVIDKLMKLVNVTGEVKKQILSNDIEDNSHNKSSKGRQHLHQLKHILVDIHQGE